MKQTPADGRREDTFWHLRMLSRGVILQGHLLYIICYLLRIFLMLPLAVTTIFNPR